MKKNSILFTILLTLCFVPSIVFAYTNNYGLSITEQEYDNLQQLYTPEYISTMTQADFNRINSLNIDYDNVIHNVKYVKTETNLITGETNDSYVSKLQYESSVNAQNDKSVFIETAYKKIDLAITQVSEHTAFFTFNNIWKIFPATRSFDVIGVRYEGFETLGGSPSGKQIYTTGGNNYYIGYTFNGTNINDRSNGFGISMNLVNNTVTYLECEIDGILIIDYYPATLFGSYQHATSNISLANSKDYYIGSGGLGSVFIYYDSDNEAIYDGMQGVNTTLTSQEY